MSRRHKNQEKENPSTKTTTAFIDRERFSFLVDLIRYSENKIHDAIDKVCKRLHDDVLHISKKPLRGELSGFLSICQAEASCISPKVY